MSEDTVSMTKYVDARIDEVKDAVKPALTSMDKRLDGMNEFRDTLKDQAARFVTREEMNLVVDRLRADIKELQLAKALLEGKASEESVNVVAGRAQWGLVLGSIGTAIALIGFASRFLTK